MRRWFALFLLALLPLQFSWAAVSGYCGHESGTRAQHLGHHVHEHAGQAVAGSSVDTRLADGAGLADTFGGADLDCSQCHGCCAGMPQPAPVLRFDLPALQPAALVMRTPLSRVLAPPDRPQWRVLA